MPKAKKQVKKPTPRQAAPAAKPDRAVIPLIKASDLASLLKKCNAAERAMSEERGSLGGLVSDAVEHKHLHKGAFGIFRRLDKMSDQKRSELLYHLDYYREQSTWDDQLDIFRTAAADGVAEDADTDTPADEGDGAEAPEKTNGKGRHREEPVPGI